MIVVVCGSRHWKNKEAIREVLSTLPAGTVIRHGACRGADLLAAEVAHELKFAVSAFPVDWSSGRSAGPRRNRAMLRAEPWPTRVIAFSRDLSSDHGTMNLVGQAKALGIRCELIGGGAWKGQQKLDLGPLEKPPPGSTPPHPALEWPEPTLLDVPILHSGAGYSRASDASPDRPRGDWGGPTPRRGSRSRSDR